MTFLYTLSYRRTRSMLVNGGMALTPFMPTHLRNPARVVIKLHSLASTEVSFR
jgi:hypothetical protein